MAIVHKAKPLGGVSFNYEVVGGTTAPTNFRKENTIWVNTDIELGEHQFSYVEPTTRADGSSALQSGDAWIQTDVDKAKMSFNAIKKNELLVYPYYVKQWNGSSWKYKESYLLSDKGETSDLICNQFPHSIIVNGVFTGDTALVTPSSTMTAWNATITGTSGGVNFNGGLFITSNNNYGQKTVRTCPTPIDFTDINKIICTVDAYNSYTSASYSDYGYAGGTYIYVVSSPTSAVSFITNSSDGLTSYSGMLAHSKCMIRYTGDIEIDVSGISGIGYIGFAQVTCAVTQSATCTVSNIKFA